MKVVHISKVKIKRDQQANDYSAELQAHWRALIRRRIRKVLERDNTTKTTTYATPDKTI